MDIKELLEQAQKAKTDALAILQNKDATAEVLEKADKLFAECKSLGARADKMEEIEKLAVNAPTETKQVTPQQQARKFTSFGDFLVDVATAGNIRYRGPMPERLEEPGVKARALAKDEPNYELKGQQGFVESGQQQKTTMRESVGAQGGFLVPTEFRAELLSVTPMDNPVRARSTVLPMTRRQINVPVLDQTGTTSGIPMWFGGMHAHWTEESGTKTQSDPVFRQISLVAHKIVCYTRSSDELLDDSAVSLEAFLRGDMGFAGAIRWHEEYAFLQGTGAGQPLGIINAGATINVPAAANPPAAGTLYDDLCHMLSHLLPSSFGRAVWFINHALLRTLLQMNGPAANPYYLWGDAVKGVPNSLLGLPVVFTEKLPAPGSSGSILLADCKYYLIGDRQSVTIDATNIERFQYDETSWRCVHRVDGQPWLSTWLTLADGSDTVSPFVILGAKST